MNSSNHEHNFVKQNFPKFELSYEIITHKKVFNADSLLAIPEGKKLVTWFTNYNGDNVCFMIEIGQDSKIIDVKNATVCFDDSLSKGTIFYGTMFNYNNINCFCIEDIYFYKGKDYRDKLYSIKLNDLKNILNSELPQKLLSNKHILFGLPLISTNFNTLLDEIQLLPYKISQIKYRFFDKFKSKKILYMKYYKPGSKYSDKNINSNQQMTSNPQINFNPQKNFKPKMNSKSIFKITADIEPDIYNLFVINNGIEKFYDLAFIPDYKTSVKLNNLFRNIKENCNLDAIEESDDEEEFENKKEDKFVYLDRSFKMVCEYNYKFKRWCPTNLAQETDEIISLNQLIHK